jgi:lipopolysaccharide/colanic/teichoic acid biosynthesis glycosyltransferase
MYRKSLKRLMDVFIALVALVILSPLILLLSIVLFFEFGGKPFFVQSRPGKLEKTIWVKKFKSMKDTRDAEGNLLPNDERLTRIGRFIRRTSSDELPQLINVIAGDLSIVGPRPLLHKYLPLYNEEQRRRHEIKPGITGWAQVNGRNAISWEHKFKLDVYYVDHCSFSLDMKILFLTLKKVFTREGVNASENVTMPPFTGTK